MKKLFIKEILSIPQLSFYMDPRNFQFFIKKKSDFEQVANLANVRNYDAIAKLMEASILTFENSENSDCFVTRIASESIQETLKENSKKIDPEAMLLFLSAVAKDFLEEIEKAEKMKHKGHSELVYTNGDIITIDNGKIGMISENPKEFDIQKIKNDLIEGILKANQYLVGDKNLNISGTYYPAGQASEPKRISFSKRELEETTKSGLVLRNIDQPKLKELLDKRLIQRHNLIKALNNNSIDKEMGIDWFLSGYLTQEELVTKVFKKSNLSGIATDDRVLMRAKLLLYSAGKIGIDVLERGTQKFQEESFDLTDTIKEISKYYKGDIKKISELLTHNVLDYTNSMEFLRTLQEDKIITEEQKSYLENLMTDFKCKELSNHTENVKVEGNGDSIPKTHYKPGLTIDPSMRMRYLESLGTVKRIKIKGESFIRDGKGETGKKNSLDGYEMFIIPDKKIAVLEKLYEVTTDQEGNMTYKRTEEGKLIPAINQATYILPIGMAKEFSQKKNKRDLIKSPYVRRANHSLDWVENMQSKMRVLNPEIEFHKENTRLWSEKIKQNYIENRDRREFDS